MVTKTLCEDFKTFSRRTWITLLECHKYGVEVSEETLTDNNLLFLIKKQHKIIKSIKFNRIEENRNGSDWEWWFLQGTKHIKIRIQAKKIKLRKNPQDYFYPKIRTQKNNQLDVLIAEAKKDKMTPFYVLYNYWDYKSFRPSNNCCSDNSLRLLGCTMCPADIINRKIGNGNYIKFQTIEKNMFPMSCIICCPKAKGNTSLDKIVDFVKNLNEDIDIRIHDEDLPNYVKRIRESSVESDESFDYSDVSENTEWITLFDLNE
jgi:hypothetical protein